MNRMGKASPEAIGPAGAASSCCRDVTPAVLSERSRASSRFCLNLTRSVCDNSDRLAANGANRRCARSASGRRGLGCCGLARSIC